MFDKLAHASIMKLNTESMDRVRKEKFDSYFDWKSNTYSYLMYWYSSNFIVAVWLDGDGDKVSNTDVQKSSSFGDDHIKPYRCNDGLYDEYRSETKYPHSIWITYSGKFYYIGKGVGTLNRRKIIII